MDCKELRIGNLFIEKQFPLITSKVEGLSFTGIIVGSYNDSLKEEDCEPIVLVEEKLLEFGFEMQMFGTIKTDAYKKGLLTIHIIGGNTGECQVAIFNKTFPIYIKYVHQLQNLYYSLTGTELITTPQTKD